jgi:hypothetical protein
VLAAGEPVPEQGGCYSRPRRGCVAEADGWVGSGQYRAPPSIFEPKSNPTYYKDLLKELEEAPNRSWLGRIAKRLGGMIRFS